MNISTNNRNQVSGKFVSLGGERFYTIHHADQLAPFFISMVSNSDHWLFASSTGGLTAGRVSPETALFPYITADRIHDSALHTGSKTLLRITTGEQQFAWEPFNREHDGRFKTSRNLYKNELGNKLCFEEINHDLQLLFRYTWLSSEEFGFVRHCELQNLSALAVGVELVDGLQNILPAGTPRFTQTNSSNLVDAYKWSELDRSTGLAFFTLYSAITDRAEPCESLKANTVFCLGFEDYKILLSTEQLRHFKQGKSLQMETHKRGIRGAYFVHAKIELAAQQSKHWHLVANLEQSQGQVVKLRKQLGDSAQLETAITASIDAGADELARIMAAADGFQLTAEENVVVHHYANVLFNVLRGGAFDDQYQIAAQDFVATVKLFNRDAYTRHRELFDSLPARQDFNTLLATIRATGDAQLERLCYQYLPIYFGRRHGDPSRPWNQFAIRLKDQHNRKLLTYQGNWRDIFQNWEALTFSYPEFIENVIAKFVNASTIDGYNPYRITNEGIDWEVEEPEDPWSYIGYWGDHQIIYLQKMLELSNQFHPARLGELLHRDLFSYANVPYRIKPFEALLENAKSTVLYDNDLAERIEQRVQQLGTDGKLILDADGQVYQVNLLEKLLVTLLCKLGNLVVDGGIWLNTQRPEWNDANNALVGQGLSVVTLCYLRRYICFLQELLHDQADSVQLSGEVGQWLTETAAALNTLRVGLGEAPLDAQQRFQSVTELGQAAARYRQKIYQQETFSGKTSEPLESVTALLGDALAVVDHTISTNLRQDGLYNAYNLLDLQTDSASIGTLYPMLEGQVAVLSAGLLQPDQAVSVVQALFDSEVYRPDQDTFMLYPDRSLPGFLEKNRVATQGVVQIPLLSEMLAAGDERIILRDADGSLRFNADLKNSDSLKKQLDSLSADYGEVLTAARQPLLALYEAVFNHQEFTGRSGGMFGFEGLGCIYWHMVAKLLLAVEENFFWALPQDDQQVACQQLGKLYYRIRQGIGFNKTPGEYGAFPTDPYSHTPKHAGAQQPGMTGQVKEEILARFGELGIRVEDGAVHFRPQLLRRREFIDKAAQFRYLDVDNKWQEITVPAAGLAFSWCQVPVVYQLDDSVGPTLTVSWDDGKQQACEQLTLPAKESTELFLRNGRIRQLSLTLGSELLFKE